MMHRRRASFAVLWGSTGGTPAALDARFPHVQPSGSSVSQRLMSAGTQNFDLGSLLRADRDEPPMPTRSPAARKPDSERLHIVRADEPELLYGKSLDDAAKSSRTPRQPPTKYPIEAQSAEPLKTVVELELETLPPRESGVDLALLRPADIDTAKLAAFMHDIPAAKKDGDKPVSRRGRRCGGSKAQSCT